MTLAEFRARVLAAVRSHFPAAKIAVIEKRGLVFNLRAELETGELIQVYFNSITLKTSYALVREEKRVLGYDNYRFWHKHPGDAPETHQRCSEPEPENVIAEMHQWLVSQSD